MSLTPAAQGWSMPAEWEPHAAVWLAWPHDPTTFTQGIEKAERTFCEIIKALEGSEKVELIVLDDKMRKRAEAMLVEFGADLGNINFHEVEYADVWTRDYGPTFLTNSAWVKWQYNVYGKAGDDEIYYAPLLKDNDVFNKLALPGQKFEPNMVLEGGSVEVNGRGTLVTTEQCLLNPDRNPNLTKDQIEECLIDYLGVRQIIWLKRGLVNDHTDGHIDDLAKFVSPDKILCAYETDPSDENYSQLKENYQVLKAATDQDGRPFEVVKLPMPHMRYAAGHTVHSGIASNSSSGQEAEKAAVSYLNFYIGNRVLLVPKFEDPNDAEALAIIQSCFPDRKVVAIDCRDIIYGGGTLHCMTQQQPLT